MKLGHKELISESVLLKVVQIIKFELEIHGILEGMPLQKLLTHYLVAGASMVSVMKTRMCKRVCQWM